MEMGAAFALGLAAGVGLGLLGPSLPETGGAAEHRARELTRDAGEPPRPARSEPDTGGAAYAGAPSTIDRSPATAASLASWTSELAVPEMCHGAAVLSGRLVRRSSGASRSRTWSSCSRSSPERCRP